MKKHKDGCAGCEYYTAEPRADTGICRRYPPIAVTDDEGFGFTQPPVDADEWCGEFFRRVS